MESTVISGDREVFAAYVSDDVSAQLLSALAAERGWSQDMVFMGGIAASVRALGAMPCPEFLIVDISDCTDPRGDVQALADVCEEGTVVLAIGTLNDVTLYRDLLNTGVHDYLVKPLSADLMRAAIVSAEEALAVSDESDQSVAPAHAQNIVVIGLAGGIGTSTLATNLAWLKIKEGSPIALLDLDVHFSNAAMQFDLEPGRGLIDALENPARVDGLFLERAVVKPNEKLAILCAEAPLTSPITPDDGALTHLIDSLGEHHRSVIIDLPRHMIATMPEVLGAASDILLVTDRSLSSARDCIRTKAFIKNAAPNAAVHLVSIRTAMTSAEVDEKDFENSVEHAFAVKAPFDAKAFQVAAQKGKIVVDAAPSSKIAAAYKEVNALFEAEDTKKSSGNSWLGKLLKK
ncbi:MAG: pilus assembly protein CpaE [Kordiimonadales bacterium]|nr:MAG: pilus assembly protein CpaE [Kordiimonadales bacterium]